MLTLDLSREPRWLDLPRGVRVKVRPIGTSLMLEVRRDPEVRDMPEDIEDEEAGVIFARALARKAIIEWEGVGDAEGSPIPVTPEGIEALMEVLPIFQRFQEIFVGPALEFEQEGNG